jgi:hypothetical protein
MKKIKKILVWTLMLVLAFSGCAYDAEDELTAGYLNFNFTNVDSQGVEFSEAGEQFLVTYRLRPKDAEILWESNDETVATVDEDGVITAVGPGECTIVATIGMMTANGQVWDSYVESEIDVSCNFD